MLEIVCSILAGAFAVLVAVVETRSKRDRQKSEERAIRRTEESRLSMELISANCKLSMVTAKKVLSQKTNGDVEEAFEAAKVAQENYSSYLMKLAAQQASKI